MVFGGGPSRWMCLAQYILARRCDQIRRVSCPRDADERCCRVTCRDVPFPSSASQARRVVLARALGLDKVRPAPSVTRARSRRSSGPANPDLPFPARTNNTTAATQPHPHIDQHGR